MGQVVSLLDHPYGGPYGTGERLTDKESVILAHLASGLTQDQVRHEMGISYSNVANTVQWIKVKLGQTTIAGLVMRAHEQGYLSHPTGPDLRCFVI